MKTAYKVFKLYVIGSLTREEKIKEIADYYESLGHEVKYVKKQPETTFSELVEDCFDNIEWADQLIVIPKIDGSIGHGVTYEIAFARRIGTGVTTLNI